MLYLIADIITSIPAAGGMSSRCRDYVMDGSDTAAEIVIDEAKYNYEYWQNLGLSRDDAAYMDSGFQFYYALLDYDGLMLHASATIIDGEAYLFAGQSGIGKSTHAELLKKNHLDALLINDDKPALRYKDGRWMVYGTPWSGKNGININAKYPLKGITLLTTERDRNEIRVADPLKAAAGLISCSAGRDSRETMKKLAMLIDRLMKDIRIYEMDSLANDESAAMAYNAMKNGLQNED